MSRIIAWLRRFACACAAHEWEHCGNFAFCSRLECRHVIWFPGTGHTVLDICNTEFVYDYVDVWPDA